MKGRSNMDDKILILKPAHRDGKFIGYRLEKPTADCGELQFIDVATVGYRLAVEHKPIEFDGPNDAGVFLLTGVDT